jgi:hypothetical protein
MAYFRKDDLSRSPNLQLRVPEIPDRTKAPAPPPRPWWIPPYSPSGTTYPFGSPPPQPQQELPDFHLWDELTKPGSRDAPAPPLTFFPSPSFPGNKDSPFPDPPPPSHDVDPSERTPYNDPDYSPFLVTENLSGQADAKPAGGFLGRLLALQDEWLRNAAAAYKDDGSGYPRMAQTDAAPPQEFPDAAPKPVHILSRRAVR